MTYQPQVGKSHYQGAAYRSKERWVSYHYQIELIERTGAKTVLEVGVGAGVLARELSARGISVTTLDIAEDLAPDIVGSVTSIPLPEKSVDVAVAFEILEHVRFEDVPHALRELARVARTHVILSLPHPGWVFSCVLKVPLLPRLELFFQIPFFWKRHVFDGEHYWELGKRGYPVRRFLCLAEKAGLRCISRTRYADDPGHRFFSFTKV